MTGEFLLYKAPDGSSRIQVRLEDRTLWLTQQQLADLYESTPQNITQHIRAIYAESELTEAATCKPYLQVRSEAGRHVSRSLKHNNLHAVIGWHREYVAGGSAHHVSGSVMGGTRL
jgi:hypothetical protein